MWVIKVDSCSAKYSDGKKDLVLVPYSVEGGDGGRSDELRA